MYMKLTTGNVVKIQVLEEEVLPLHRACEIGHLDMVATFLQTGCDINALDGNGDTALFYAIRYQHEDVADFLIAKGADINIVDDMRVTPLLEAIDRKSVV